MQIEFLAYAKLDENNNGKGFSVVVDNLDKLKQAITNATDFKEIDEFLDVYNEDEGLAVYFELMSINGIMEHLGWVDIKDGNYTD